MANYNLFEHKDGKQTAYFRGRKLKGEVMAVPEGYRGLTRFAS